MSICMSIYILVTVEMQLTQNTATKGASYECAIRINSILSYSCFTDYKKIPI